MLDPVIHKMITYVQNLEEKDLKDKVLFYIYPTSSCLRPFCVCVCVDCDLNKLS